MSADIDLSCMFNFMQNFKLSLLFIYLFVLFFKRNQSKCDRLSSWFSSTSRVLSSRCSFPVLSSGRTGTTCLLAVSSDWDHSLENTRTSLTRTNSCLKVTHAAFLPHSDAHFEPQPVAFAMSTVLNVLSFPMLACAYRLLFM